MPTTRHLLLLAAIACASAARGDSATITPDFARARPTTASAGPRGMPRRIDHAVEPASFRPLAEPKPITEPPEDPPSEKPSAAPVDSPQAAHAPPIDQSPPDAISKSPESEARRPLSLKAKDGAALPTSTGLPENPMASLMEWRPSTETLTATGGGLAIAVGLILALTWLVRACAPKSARPLPRDVIEVLGRTPLGGKQTGQLVRVGSKLVLVAITPDGAEPITEITDPGEVARLLAACDTSRGRGSAAEFDAMLREMADERTTPGFVDTPPHEDAAYGFDPRALAAAYADTPGGRGDV